VAVATVACRAQLGLAAPLVQVEVSLASGLPAFCIVGLPATVIKESKERVRAALTNSGFAFPAGRITVSLAPAELPKEGGRFDLPIALGILLASGQLRGRPQGESLREFYGELGLTGELKPVRGLLLAAVHARRHGHELVVPCGNAREACAAAPRHVRAAGHLLEVCAHLSGASPLPPHPALVEGAAAESAGTQTGLDLADVRGQWLAKRALVVAAAGAHSLLLIGPPGSGKTMLAQRLPGLLPPLAEGEALEVAAIAAVSSGGFAPERYGQRPFRTPHHTSARRPRSADIAGGSLHPCSTGSTCRSRSRASRRVSSPQRLTGGPSRRQPRPSASPAHAACSSRVRAAATRGSPMRVSSVGVGRMRWPSGCWRM